MTSGCSGFLYIDCVLPLREKALIARIRHRERLWPGIATGIGDDCAVLKVPAGHELLVTTDFSLENVHFRREWHPAESVGHRCLTRGLSDVAAMGGKPLAAFLSLALPKNLPQSWVDRFFDGFFDLANQHRVTLAGGDIAQSPQGILADIMVVGSVPMGKAVRRSGAKHGDLIYVTGELGGAAQVLAELQRGRKQNLHKYPRHFFPQARLEVGQFLRANHLVSAMIDLSDGLSTDLSHICEESGVGVQIIEAAIPRAGSGQSKEKVALSLALHGGDDYELLFTVRPNKKMSRSIAGVPITQIGRVTREKQIVLVKGNGHSVKLQPSGWEHFAQ